LLVYRIRADVGGRRNAVLAGDARTGTAAGELHTVVGAADDLAIHMALAQRHRPVAAAIHQRADPARGGPEQHHGFIQEAAAEAFAGLYVGREGGDVPHIAQEHGVSPVWAAAAGVLAGALSLGGESA